MAGTTRIPPKEEIEVRAYALYLERGAISGHDVDDWLAAEKELSAQLDETANSKVRKGDKAAVATTKGTAKSTSA